MKAEYLGKFLLLSERNDKILVIGDLHLGYEASLRESGILVVEHLFEELMGEIENALEKAGKVGTIVLLGDVKHSFGSISYYERDQFKKILSILEKKAKRIIVIKGNHDKLLEYIRTDTKKSIRDTFVKKGVAFIHGDKDFDEIWKKEVKTIIMGHLHPAVYLEEGAKREKYKCFLAGMYRGKEIIIMPSATGKNEGTDPREYDTKLPWPMKLDDFDVVVCGEGLENYKFGKLKKL